MSNTINAKVQIMGGLFGELNMLVSEPVMNPEYVFIIEDNYKAPPLRKEYIYIPAPRSRGKNKTKKY